MFDLQRKYRPWYINYDRLSVDLPEAVQAEREFREDLRTGKIHIASQKHGVPAIDILNKKGCKKL